MAASMRKVFVLRSFLRIIPNRYGCSRYTPSATFCAAPVKSERTSTIDVAGLFTDSDTAISVPDTSNKGSEKSFATMFRESTFVQLGDIRDKYVNGRIIDIVDDDLYIDLGGKFNCVCPKPSYNSGLYVKRKRVIVMLHQFEMSSSFLGTPKHVTLLEADGTLLGVFETHSRSRLEQHNKDTSEEKEEASDEIHANSDDTNTNVNNENELEESVLTSKQSDDLK